MVGVLVSNPFRAGGEALVALWAMNFVVGWIVSNPFRAGGEALATHFHTS